MTQPNTPLAPDDAGTLVHALESPAFDMAPPHIDNVDLIPENVRRVCEVNWHRGRFAERTVRFRLFRDVIVAGEGLVFTIDLGMVAESAADHRPEEIAFTRAAVVEAAVRNNLPAIGGTCVLCVKRGAANYGHWLIEMFPKAVLAQENLPYRDLRFIVPRQSGRLGAAIADCGQWLGASEAAWLPFDGVPMRVDRLVVVDGLTRHGAYMSPLAIEAVRRHAPLLAPGPDAALYVSRESVGHRLLREEAVVVERARAAGFRWFDPGVAPLAEQVAAFAGARRVVGVMGAGLTNMVFAPEGAEVVALVPANMPDLFFWFIAGLRGLRYREIRCAPDGPQQSGVAAWDRQLVLEDRFMAELFPPLPAAPASHDTEEPPASLAEVVARFESLGDNCEFGLVQRAAGIEPLGFFRLNFARMESLLRALDNGFAGVSDPAQVEIYAEPNNELMVRIRGYGFQYHTDRHLGEVAIEELRAQQVRAVALLVRRLQEDLEAADKIFVRKGEGSATLDQVIPLFEALRRHGPATLLWVVTADAAHPSGSVEVLRPGLLKAYIDRFAPYDHAYALSDAWVEICCAALALHRRRAPLGTVLHGSTLPEAAALRPAGGLADAAWQHLTALQSAARAPQRSLFAEVVAAFESLGDNCEFGLVQRAAGIEPLGLLRFSSAPMASLLRALDSDFATIGEPDDIEIIVDPLHGELIVHIRSYDFYYHTWRTTADMSIPDMHAQQVRAVALLKRKLLEDLRAGEKIFVRRGNDSATLDDIMPLFTRLRRYGRATLLWVVPADAAHPPGTVEVLQPFLLKGYIDRFAPAADALDLSDLWPDICFGAHRLWRSESPPGTVIRDAAAKAGRPVPKGWMAAAARRQMAPPPSLAARTDLRALPSMTLAELAARTPPMSDGRPRAEPRRFLPEEMLDLPPFAFGQADHPDGGVAQVLRAEAAGARLRSAAIDAWTLRDVIVHGLAGIVTLDGQVVAETLAHVPPDLASGARPEGGGLLALHQRPVGTRFPAAYHLLPGDPHSYDHWLLNALFRFSAAQFVAMGSVQQAPGVPVLLVAELDVPWKWETLHLYVPDDAPRAALTEEGAVFAQRLLYIPDLTGGMLQPRRALLDGFDALATLYGHPPAAPRQPWRRLFLARVEGDRRTLVNEAEVIARAERAGFTSVVLSEHAAAEQMRLFADASHIIAPHGAGLANLGFCRRGTALCELFADGDVRWSFRRLAALRGLRYGCVVGEAVAQQGSGGAWRIDPDAIDAVLGDPGFIGD